MSTISLLNYTKRYDDACIYQDFSYDFSHGLYRLDGPNGAGKSTLLRSIAGIDLTFAGGIYYSGKCIKEHSNSYKSNMTYLPDQPIFYPGVSGLEFINLVASIRRIDPRPYLAKYAPLFEIGSYLHHPVESLSLGQRKKIFLVVTLIDEAEVWLLDEPSNGLDKKSVAELGGILNEHAEHRCIILSDHNADLCRHLNERLVPISS